MTTLAKFDWKQIGGDMNPGTYGALIAKCEGDYIEVVEIQPVREFMGDSEAKEIGYPFWSKEACYDASDLDPSNDDVVQALKCCDIDLSDYSDEDIHPLIIAEALMQYGCGADPGPYGWAVDVVPARVQWWATTRPNGWRFLSDGDIEFRALLRE